MSSFNIPDGIKGTPRGLVVYRITSLHGDEEKYYIGSTSEEKFVNGKRLEEHLKTDRYKDAEIKSIKVVWHGYDTIQCLKAESDFIEEALGGYLPDGNREHFNGRCLNRTTKATAPVGFGYTAGFSKACGYFFKGYK